MKFNFKIFAFSFFVIITSLAVGGFIIITSTFKRELNQTINQSIRDNNLLVNYYESITETSSITNKNIIINQIKNTFNRSEVFIGDIQDLKWISNKEHYEKLDINTQEYNVVSKNNKYYLQVVTKAKYNDIIYFENLNDITNIYITRNKNYQTYNYIIIFISIISSSITLLFSLYVTKPLKYLQDLTIEISKGNYKSRIKNTKKTMKSPEFIALANSFNDMTKEIDDYINQLKEYNKRQERFVASFSHELKTPLTSIIGYADYLRTYDITTTNQELVNYIYQEGKRLEELSHHLLELNLLKKGTINLQKININTLSKEVFSSLKPLGEKYHVSINLDLEETTILIEPSLIKSLIYNLVDNACKSGTDKVIVKGLIKEKKYCLSIIDYGRGIPSSSLKKVTEPFYMVDKSRSRKQGGAGLGLSLVKEIAILHKSDLKIFSKEGFGTTISLELEVDYEK